MSRALFKKFSILGLGGIIMLSGCKKNTGIVEPMANNSTSLEFNVLGVADDLIADSLKSSQAQSAINGLQGASFVQSNNTQGNLLFTSSM